MTDARKGLIIALLTGMASYGIKALTDVSFIDPLVTALIAGIVIRSLMKGNEDLEHGLRQARSFFIPLGIALYAAANLNFIKVWELQSSMIILLIVIMFVYFSVVFVLGRFLGQRKEITALIAVGSAICGASAIAITSPAVDAEPDDVSVSLISVALAALVGLFIILPFVATLFNMTDMTYAMLSGSVLQFTGFVRTAIENIPPLTSVIPSGELRELALSFKAARYLELLIAIPLLASIIKKKLYFPWVLWVYLIFGIIGTVMYAWNEVGSNNVLLSYIKPAHRISWSIAMAAIGLSADIKVLLSNNGSKALMMSFAGFIAATITFFIGIYIIQNY